jgi:hypothetical protein
MWPIIAIGTLRPGSIGTFAAAIIHFFFSQQIFFQDGSLSN